MKLNEFALHFDGSVALPDSINTVIDLTFNTDDNSFRSLFSLVPEAYKKDYENIQTKGNLSLDGVVKGTLNETQTPTFNINLKVEEAMVKYPDLPSTLNNININLTAEEKTGNLDNLIVNIPQFVMDIGRSPFSLKGMIAGLSKTRVDAEVKTNLNLTELSEALPLPQNMVLQGNLNIDATANGVYDTLTKSMPAFKVSAGLTKGYVKTEDLPAPLEQLEASVFAQSTTGNIDDVKINLQNLAFVLDNQPLQASGTVENLDNYTWDMVIKGNHRPRQDDQTLSARQHEHKGYHEDGYRNCRTNGRCRCRTLRCHQK